MNNGNKDLKVYQKAYKVAMEIFLITKSFPIEERYSLTDQVRRSSRSVCVNIAEGYRKRIYPKHFVSKLSDADSEAGETTVHLDFAKDCGYIDENKYKLLIEHYSEVGKMLGSMMTSPEKFLPKKSLPTAN